MQCQRTLMAMCLSFPIASQVAVGQQQITMETRFVAQVINGAGAGRQITNATNTVFALGSKVRVTLQYRLIDHTEGQYGSIFGMAEMDMDIRAIGVAGNGTLSRSLLTTTGTSQFNAESGVLNNSYGWADGPVYPQSGTAASSSGLHAPYRAGINGFDGGGANGTVNVDGIQSIKALAGGSAATVNQAGGQWWGLYSFEFQANPSFSGTVGFRALAGELLRPYRGTDASSAGSSVIDPRFTHTNSRNIALRFGQGSSAPLVSTYPRTITINPSASGDADNLLLATFSDPELTNSVDVTITDDDGIIALGGRVTIADDRTAAPSIMLSWDPPNSALGREFWVSFAYANGVHPETLTGRVRVIVVPSPGAAAMICLAGLRAVRRRRK